MAARAYLDGYYREGLEAADRAVKLTRRILRRTPDDQRVIEVLVDRHRWRALIHEELGNQTAAINDAEAAITLCGRLDDSPPLQIPALRLLQCEMYGVMGEVAAAREAGQAVEAYRQLAREGDVHPLAMAHALSRYAAGMALAGDVEAARPARREAVDAYRASLDENSFARDQIRFAWTVQELVADAEPPSAAAAPELLPMLQEAAEQRVSLIPPSPYAFREAKVGDHGTAVCQILATQSRWLDALGAPRTAAVFAQSSREILFVPPQWWPDRLRSLRDLLERALAADADPA